MRFFTLPVLLCGHAAVAGDPQRKHPLTCEEQIEAKIAENPIENGKWECLQNEGGGLTTCRQMCDHGGRTKAQMRCRTMTRVLKEKKMDQQDCGVNEWKQLETGKCSAEPPYKITGKKGGWKCEVVDKEKDSMAMVTCQAACPHVDLPTVTCRTNRGEWSDLPKRFEKTGLRCEKPKPKCTDKDRDKTFPIKGNGAWTCKQTSGHFSSQKVRQMCQMKCESGEVQGKAEIFCTTKGSDGWQIKTEGSFDC